MLAFSKTDRSSCYCIASGSFDYGPMVVVTLSDHVAMVVCCCHEVSGVELGASVIVPACVCMAKTQASYDSVRH